MRWDVRWEWFVVAMVAAVAVAVATVNGLRIGGDSYVYFHAAEALADGRGYVVDGSPVVHWPVGYPAVLSIGSHMVDLFTAARMLNVALMATAVLLGCVLARQLGARRSAVAGGILVATSPAVMLTATAFLSEMLFLTIVLAVGVLVARDGGWWHVVALAAVAGAACLVRWAGVAVLAGAAVGMLLGRRAWPERAARAGVVAAGLVPMSVNALRNRSVAGTPLGDRDPSEVGLVEVFGQVFPAMGEALIRHVPQAHTVVGVAVVAGLVWVAWRSLADDSRRRVLLLGAAYYGFILISRWRSGFDDLNPRFLVPGLPLLAALWVAVPGWSRARTVAVGTVAAVGAAVCLRLVVSGAVDGPQQRPDLFPEGQAMYCQPAGCLQADQGS